MGFLAISEEFRGVHLGRLGLIHFCAGCNEYNLISWASQRFFKLVGFFTLAIHLSEEKGELIKAL